MTLLLRDAMMEILSHWKEDLNSSWRALVSDVELGFDAIDPTLILEPWEPIFPVRKGKRYLGAPEGAHMFRAFDGIRPEQVRVVVLGQDPYPCGAFSTGRAFEAGNVAWWRELEKMFSVSVRTFMLLIAAARTNDPSYTRSVREWPRLRREIESGTLVMEPPAEIADRWVKQGVLLLNSALTLSRFAVEGDPHQTRGHFPLWSPFMTSVLRGLSRSGKPIVFIGFGDQAAETLARVGVPEMREEAGTPTPNMFSVIRKHPARGNEVLAAPNPFVIANRHLESGGETPVRW